MRLLNFSGSKSTVPQELRSRRVALRRPQLEHFEAWAELRRASADFLRPYEPQWTRDELSRSAFRTRLRRHESDINSGRGMPWFLFLADENESTKPTLLGGVTLSNIRRGVADTGTLGYWMGAAYAGQGYMSEAVRAVCQFSFHHHGLHRIEAATVLDNERSQRLLVGCGFQQEGIARAYLKIAGEWRDHRLFARLASDPDRGPDQGPNEGPNHGSDRAQVQ
ncbi:MAG: GNAT family protein [Pseudomonadota bacterium]